MDDLNSRLEKLKAARLTRQQRRVLELLAANKTYDEIADELRIKYGSVVYHIVNLYAKLDLDLNDEASRSQRQRELAHYALALKAQPALDSDAEALAEPVPEEQPSPEALKGIAIVKTVVEDGEHGIAVRSRGDLEALSRHAFTEDRQVRRHSPKQNPARFLYLATGIVLVFLLGLLAGTRIPAMGAAAPIKQADATAVATSGPASDVALLSPAATLSSTTAVAVSVCGESARVTAPAADRLIRSQGVSAFTAENTANAVAGDKVRSIALDKRGLWIGYYSADNSAARGLGQYDKQTWASCNANGGPLNQNINALQIDTEGRVWAATENGGVFMFDGKTWRTFNGLPSQETFGLTVDKQGVVWVDTLEGIAKFNGVDQWETVYTAAQPSIAANNTHALAFDDNNVWVGHISDGVSRYSKSEGRWLHYNAAANSLSGNNIRAILVQTAGGQRGTDGVWFATEDGGISRFANEQWISYHVADGLPGEAVEALAVDHYQRIWAATQGGVAYFTGSQWVKYDSLPTFSIAIGADCANCPFEANEHVWTGTNSKGVTQSRLPFDDRALSVTQICFTAAQLARTCQQYPPETSISGTGIITATYPGALAPGDKFQPEIFLAPNPPYQFAVGDMLTSMDDSLVMATFEHVAVEGTIAVGEPFKFADYNKPFVAPTLAQGDDKQTFVSTWRMWMHTRYAGPIIRIVATVSRAANSRL